MSSSHRARYFLSCCFFPILDNLSTFLFLSLTPPFWPAYSSRSLEPRSARFFLALFPCLTLALTSPGPAEHAHGVGSGQPAKLHPAGSSLPLHMVDPSSPDLCSPLSSLGASPVSSWPRPPTPGCRQCSLTSSTGSQVRSSAGSPASRHASSTCVEVLPVLEMFGSKRSRNICRAPSGFYI